MWGGLPFVALSSLRQIHDRDDVLLSHETKKEADLEQWLPLSEKWL